MKFSLRQHLSTAENKDYQVLEKAYSSYFSQKFGTTTIHRKLCTSQQYTLVATKANYILGRNIKPVAIREREEILPLYSVPMRLQLEYCAPFGTPQHRMDTYILEHVQWKAIKIVKGLLQDIGEQLRELSLFSLKKTTLGTFYCCQQLYKL